MLKSWKNLCMMRNRGRTRDDRGDRGRQGIARDAKGDKKKNFC
jgi:hypothetical protein